MQKVLAILSKKYYNNHMTNTDTLAIDTATLSNSRKILEKARAAAAAYVAKQPRPAFTPVSACANSIYMRARLSA